MLTAIALIAVLQGRGKNRVVMWLLAFHWAWVGIAYHLAYFAAINPAAVLFAVAFLAQAGLFAFFAVTTPPAFSWKRDPRYVAGVALAGYGLAYPVIAVATGHAYPRVPTFGVPCPTTLLTVGLLLMSEPLRPSLLVIPLLWSIIGGSAAVLLGMTPDYALLAAFVIAALVIVSRKQGIR